MQPDEPNIQHVEPLPRAPGSGLMSAFKVAAIYAAGMAAVAALGSKIPGLNRIFSRGASQEAKEAAKFGGVVGAVVGFHDNRVRHEEIYPLQVENHLLKTGARLEPSANHAEKVSEERAEIADPSTEPGRF